MELMSSLLLCALVPLLATVSGEGEPFMRTDWGVKVNNTKMIGQKSSTHKKILLNINGPPLVNVVSELQSVFADHACQRCIECMERGIKAYRTVTHVVDIRPSAEEIQHDVLNSYYKVDTERKKRGVVTKPIGAETEAKKSKTKEDKLNKVVNVTKYNIGGEVYALKVKETTQANNAGPSSTTCLVYSVKKSFPCDTPEGDMILTVAKRKLNKKIRKEKEKNKSSVTTVTTEKVLPIFRKRQVDNSQVPENFMPSIEELY